MHKTDVVIIGAGPIGLFQIFELGLQGLSAHVIESLPHAGGQCAELYPDKPIYDIPAIPVCTGLELTDNLMKQCAPFSPVIHYEQEAVSLETTEQGFHLVTAKGMEFDCRAVVIAAGGGSFTPVKLRVDGIDQFIDTQMFYRVRDPSIHAGKDIVLLGGGDSALDWALDLYSSAKSLTLINRTERFRAVDASVTRLESLAAENKLSIKLGRVTDFRQDDGKLTEVLVNLRDKESEDEWIPLDHLLVFFGMSPKIGEIENWGLELARKHLVINTTTFETSMSGVYAIGDINTYPGKKKLILSGFHEAAMTAYAIKQQFEPDKKVSVQYTTTSSEMQDRLGV